MGKVLTFRETLVQENAMHRILGKIICDNSSHQFQGFIDKETGKPMDDWGYCKRCLGTLQAVKEPTP